MIWTELHLNLIGQMGILPLNMLKKILRVRNEIEHFLDLCSKF